MLLEKSVKGQGLVEYALIIALIALVVVIAVSAFGNQLTNTFDFITSQIPDA